jgi:hypothetical protein
VGAENAEETHGEYVIPMKTCSVILFWLLLSASPSGAFDCHCTGCGCEGGPGWRVLTTGHCVRWKRFKTDCGDPPNNKLCACEGVAQVCPSQSREPIPPHKVGCTID